MATDYAQEKFYTAIRTLASGTGDSCDRLGDAYVYHLIHLKEEDLGTVLWEKLEAIAEVITAKTPPPGNEMGAVKYTLQSMSADEASELINQILNIAEKLGTFGL